MRAGFSIWGLKSMRLGINFIIIMVGTISLLMRSWCSYHVIDFGAVNYGALGATLPTQFALYAMFHTSG
jgi:hypothetical protein